MVGSGTGLFPYSGMLFSEAILAQRTQRGVSRRFLVQCSVLELRVKICLFTLLVGTSVADPDPQYPYVFGPPGSGSISMR